MNVHNLILGTPYIDVSDKSTVRNLDKEKGEYGVLRYYERGWNSSSHFRVEGEVYTGATGGSKGEIVYKIEGRWNESATLINVKTGEREVLWRKNPFPENW
jgi:hypothetical protein